MRVVIAGGHGQVALLLERLLAERGDDPVGIVRNPDHLEDVETTGAEAVLLDLEETDAARLAEVLRGADAVVFAAGGGPSSGVERKETVDRGAAVLLADAAERAGVRRYVMVSAMGTETVDPDSQDVFAVYLRAKAAADDDLRSRPGLDRRTPRAADRRPGRRSRAGRLAAARRGAPGRRGAGAGGGAAHRRHHRVDLRPARRSPDRRGGAGRPLRARGLSRQRC